MKIPRYRWLHLKTIREKQRGTLWIAQQNDSIPFPLHRVYVIRPSKRKNLSRGNHAHRRLTQAIFCIQGSCKLNLSDGKKRKTFRLSHPSKGMLIRPGVWLSLDSFSLDCLILVFNSGCYDRNDYVRRWDRFLAHVSGDAF